MANDIDRGALAALLDPGLDALGVDRAASAPLLDYLALLARWNRAYNLTAIRDPAGMVRLHLLDSLAMHAHVRGVARLADLGAGAGLPGIPLALAVPGLSVTLVESAGKKARFMREAVRSLGLGGRVDVVEGRAEALDAPGAYDAVTARALATLPELVGFGGHLLAPGGRLLAMKGQWPEPGDPPLPAGWRVEAVHPLAVPGVDAARHLVVAVRG